MKFANLRFDRLVIGPKNMVQYNCTGKNTDTNVTLYLIYYSQHWVDSSHRGHIMGASWGWVLKGEGKSSVTKE